MKKRAQPIWERVAILLAIAAIWPALLNWQVPDLNWPEWLTWGLLVAALVAMVGIFVRRVARLRRLVERGPEEGPGGPFPGPPPDEGPPE